MNNMEGRWGRRIFGSITKGAEVTIFNLTLETREGRHIHSGFRAANHDLDKYPTFYGEILSLLIQEIENAINTTQGDHPC